MALSAAPDSQPNPGLHPAHGDLADGEGQPEHAVEHADHDGRAQQGVGQHLVQGVRHPSALDLFVAVDHVLLEQGGDVPVAVVRDEGLQVRVQGLAGVALLGLGQLEQMGVGREVLCPADVADGIVALQVLEGDPARGQVGQNFRLLDDGGHLQQGGVHVRPVGDVQGLHAALVPARELHGLADQLGPALTLAGHGLHHGHAQERGQLGRVDALLGAPDLVHHVQGQDQGHAHLQELNGQVEAALQGVGVHHVDDRVGAALHQELAGRLLLFGVGRQGIGAGQVHHGDFLAVVLERALLAGHGDAGIVAHVLPGAGQGVEHGGLAGVGIAGQGDVETSFHVTPPWLPGCGRLRCCAG